MAVLGQRDIKRRAAHVDGDDIGLLEWRRYEEPGLWSRCRAGVDGIDRAVGHRLAYGEATVGLEVAHRLLGAQ